MCSIQTPWTTIALAVDRIVRLVRTNGDEFEVVGNCAFVARLLQRVFRWECSSKLETFGHGVVGNVADLDSR